MVLDWVRSNANWNMIRNIVVTPDVLVRARYTSQFGIGRLTDRGQPPSARDREALARDAARRIR